MTNYIDFHCDVLSKAYMNNKDTIIDTPDAMVNINKLVKASCLAQFFAIFMIPKSNNEYYKQQFKKSIPNDQEYIEHSFEIMENTIKQANDKIEIAYNFEDLERINNSGKIASFLTFEDGRAVNGSMEKLEEFYKKGIRLISLTWNEENCFGFPNSNDKIIMNSGLTDFGKDAIVRMNELGMIVDVSHLSDGGFYDVAKISKKPFIASHSNSRVLSPHKRNLTDDMIKILGEKGGVAGINFCGVFLQPDCKTNISTLDLIVKHIKYIANVGGIETVSIGADFDGIGGELEIGGCEDMQRLFEELHRAGFSYDEVDKIAYLNAKRVIKEVL
ncbi:MAG: dipeptidase [Lachnospirales bacterium]